jgi:hypothetical protein
MFKTIKTSFDASKWANEADFDAEVLYSDGIKA